MSSSTSGHHPSRADEGSLAPPGRFSGPLPPFLLRHSARPWRPPTRAPRTAHAPPPPRRRRRPSGPLGGALPSPSPPPSRGRAEASEPLPDQNPPLGGRPGSLRRQGAGAADSPLGVGPRSSSAAAAAALGLEGPKMSTKNFRVSDGDWICPDKK